jgi:hypothetical protein
MPESPVGRNVISPCVDQLGYLLIRAITKSLPAQSSGCSTANPSRIFNPYPSKNYGCEHHGEGQGLDHHPGHKEMLSSEVRNQGGLEAEISSPRGKK